MSDEKETYTLEEMRKAFVTGTIWYAGRSMGATDDSYDAARCHYPSPRKLREVEIGGTRYRVKDGVVQYFHDSRHQWDRSNSYDAGLIIAPLVDLITHPYEEETA